MTLRLHLVTRSDLTTGQQAVQAAHALREFSEHCPEADRVWYQKSNTLAMLVTQNEKELGDLLRDAQARGIPAVGFREPDRGNELTAVAIGPQGKGLCRHLPLAFAKGGSCALGNAHEPPTQEQVPRQTPQLSPQ